MSKFSFSSFSNLTQHPFQSEFFITWLVAESQSYWLHIDLFPAFKKNIQPKVGAEEGEKIQKW